MCPHLWVLDLLVIDHPAHPWPPRSNSPGQNYYLNMLLANCFQCNQQASLTANQVFQPFSPQSIDSEDTQIIETRKGLWFYFHFCCVKKNICVTFKFTFTFFLPVYKKSCLYLLQTQVFLNIGFYHVRSQRKGIISHTHVW